jgi:hypothetical protein
MWASAAPTANGRPARLWGTVGGTHLTAMHALTLPRRTAHPSAIARRRDKRRARAPPGILVVVLDPVLCDVRRPLWGNSVVKDMLGMVAELDEKGDGGWSG